jgi:pimeloyl-ACP methyl ester carboxylesterase
MNPLPHETTGNEKSKQIVVFLHGWPDTLRLWDPIIPNFSKDYYILNVSYPNFSEKEILPWGIDTPELIDRLKVTLEQNNKANRKVTFVTHDWGAIFGYYFDSKYPKNIDDMIAIDVAPKIKSSAGSITYQSILILGFLLGGRMGNWLTHYIRGWAKYEPAYADKINCSFNYPYYYTYKNFSRHRETMRSYVPSCSMAFIFGAKKKMNFHIPEWLDEMKTLNPDNEVVAADSMHWVMNDAKDTLVELISKRLKMVAKRNNLSPS